MDADREAIMWSREGSVLSREPEIFIRFLSADSCRSHSSVRISGLSNKFFNILVMALKFGPGFALGKLPVDCGPIDEDVSNVLIRYQRSRPNS